MELLLIIVLVNVERIIYWEEMEEKLIGLKRERQKKLLRAINFK
jgi:hypothetical protein